METASSSRTVATPAGFDNQVLAAVIVTCAFIQGVDLSMFTATMKALEEYFAVNPMSLGFVLLLQGLASAVTAPLWGMLADRHCRIKLLSFNMFGISVLTFLTGMSYSFPLLCVTRMFTGVFSAGLGPIAQTMLASAVQPDERSKYFSWMLVATQVGIIGGSIYGASLSHQSTFEHQGWRFTFISMAFLTMLVAVTGYFMYETLVKTLRRALVVSTSTSDVGTNALAILSKRSFVLLLCQGAFASTWMAAGSFLIEIFQYAGFADFQASTLVGWISFGSIIGALVTGYWADICAKKDPATGRIFYGTAGNCGMIIILCAMALGGVDTMLNVRHYYELGAICFFMGLFQFAAYIGAVKPILSEIVPRRLAGQALAYAAGFDGAIASVAGAPLVATISQKLFNYQPTDAVIAHMSRELRRNNLMALAKSYMLVMSVSIIAATLCFAMLKLTYESDKNESAREMFLMMSRRVC